MSRTNIYLSSIIFLLVSLFSSCMAGSQNMKTEPALYLNDFEVQYRLIHKGIDSSSFHLIVESEDYELAYIAYATNKKKVILAEDKLSIRGKKDEVFEHQFKIRDTNYYMELQVRDKTENRIFRDAFLADKTKAFDYLQITSKGKPLVRSYVPIDTEVNLYHPQQTSVWVKYFDKEFKSATPPFSDKGYKFNPKKNINQLVEVPNDGIIKLEGEGLYFIQADTNSLDGFYLNVFEERFPRISSSEQMISAARYIAKRGEYNTMFTSDNPKSSIDDFWLNRTDDNNFAKELIKTYYTRIQIANRDFTTYKEGWKTDRGMLYTIFGPPNYIQKTLEEEIWLYDASRRRSSMRFQFKKVNGQTLLVRSDYFKRSWDLEIYEWRKGMDK